MGNQPTKENPNDQYENCLLRRSEEIPALGKFDIYEDPHSRNFYLAFESSYAITNQELAESEIAQLRKLDSISNLAHLLRNSVGKSQMLCFENYAIFLKFEFYNDNLHSLTKSRGPTAPVPEHEIWQVASAMIDFLIQLNRFGLSHGDLQPKHVLMTSDRQVRILMPLIYTTYQNAYRLRLANDDYKSTFSPEALNDYNMRNNSPTYDTIRADIFSVGVCLLSYIHGEDYQTYFNFKDNTVYFDKIKDRLSQMIRMKYSEELFFLINLCVKQNAYERGTLDALAKVLKKRYQTRGDFKIGNTILGA
jgi:hypothetical protein